MLYFRFQIGTFLATGRLGKVTYGQYQARAVCIKHLSHFNFELSDDYMKQIANFARLEHVNVLKIEGLLTKSYPHLIVMEEAAYSLKAFFAHQSPKMAHLRTQLHMLFYFWHFVPACVCYGFMTPS